MINARTQDSDTTVDVDEGPKAIFGRLKALKAYPDFHTTVDVLLADLLKRVEIHFHDIDTFTRRYGSKIKALRGDYGECRGYQRTRDVGLPGSVDALALADQILADVWSVEALPGRKPKADRVTMIARGVCDPHVGNIPSWVVVQYPRSVAEFTDLVRAALQRAVDLNIIRLSWPDPRMVEHGF